MKMFRKNEGFTLVELMVVVLIIGILVAIAVPVFLNASANAQAKSCQANQRTIIGAIQTYNATNTDAPLTGSAGAVLGDGAYAGLFSATKGTIKSVPTCPSKSGATAAKGQYWMVGLDVNSDTGVSETASFTANPTHKL